MLNSGRRRYDTPPDQTRREWLRYEIGVQRHDLKWAELVSYIFGGHASIQA
jgi:hypothetical protein